jgi:hypothetical protein
LGVNDQHTVLTADQDARQGAGQKRQRHGRRKHTNDSGGNTQEQRPDSRGSHSKAVGDSAGENIPDCRGSHIDAGQQSIQRRIPTPILKELGEKCLVCGLN